ncbi:MAG: pyridoxamine 5'-phosphate oxidase family protein [Candidatus Binatia bacterium]
MNQQRKIQLTPDEQAAFLQEPHKAALATVDKDGFPHVVAMGFLAKDGALYMTSYAKAQKVVNIRRNPKVGVMIETGQSYAEFRGLMIRGHCEIISDRALVEMVIRAAREKQGNPVSPTEAINSAPKRVVLKITPEKIASWDHTKLGGRY